MDEADEAEQEEAEEAVLRSEGYRRENDGQETQKKKRERH